jgi:hypothetical protein
MTMQTDPQVDVERYWRDGYLMAPWAGDMTLYMTLFGPYLQHYSDLNRSTVPRRSIIYTYNPAHLGTINEGRFPPDGAEHPARAKR